MIIIATAARKPCATTKLVTRRMKKFKNGKETVIPSVVLTVLLLLSLFHDAGCDASNVIDGENNSNHGAPKDGGENPFSSSNTANALEGPRSMRFPSVAQRVKLYMSHWYYPPCKINSDHDNNEGNIYEGFIHYNYININNITTTMTNSRRLLVQELKFPEEENVNDDGLGVVPLHQHQLEHRIEPDTLFYMNEDDIVTMMDDDNASNAHNSDYNILQACIEHGLDISKELQHQSKHQKDRIRALQNMKQYCIDVMNSFGPAIQHARLHNNNNVQQQNNNTHNNNYEHHFDIPLVFQFGDLRHSHRYGDLNIPRFHKFRPSIPTMHQHIQQTTDLDRRQQDVCLDHHQDNSEKKNILLERQRGMEIVPQPNIPKTRGATMNTEKLSTSSSSFPLDPNKHTNNEDNSELNDINHDNDNNDNENNHSTNYSNQQQLLLQPIIWKLDTHRHYGSLHRIYEYDTTAWSQKVNKAIFRGQLTGSLHDGYNRHNTDEQNCLLLRRCRLVYNSMVQNKSQVIDAKLTSTRNRLPNTIIVHNYHRTNDGNDNTNGGNNGDNDNNNLLSKNSTDAEEKSTKKEINLIGKSVTISELLQYKAIIMLEGNDVASGLKWALLSSSVVLMPKPKCTSWTMEELLQPWVHYIPIHENTTDVEEKMLWVIHNDDEAKKIAERATLWIQDLIFHPDSIEDDRLIQQEMLRRYYMHFKQYDEKMNKDSNDIHVDKNTSNDDENNNNNNYDDNQQIILQKQSMKSSSISNNKGSQRRPPTHNNVRRNASINNKGKGNAATIPVSSVGSNMKDNNIINSERRKKEADAMTTTAKTIRRKSSS